MLMAIVNSWSAQSGPRAFCRRIANAIEVHRRQRLSLPIGDAATPRPSIYFLTPDYWRPAGGIRVIYRHVDILNSAGLRAFVLHQQPGFRCDWFHNQTCVTNVQSAKVLRGDLLVVPEVDADLLANVPKSARYVLFNQNVHLTWQRISASDMKAIAQSPGLAGMLTVSAHNKELLEHAFPGAPVKRVHIGIDAALFKRGSDARRAARITYMPRRGKDDAQQVLNVLHSRGTLDGWDVVALDGLSHQAVADQLRMSRIFLAFTHQEGFGLPAAEAMACGNYVIGSSGFGGSEFFRAEFSQPVESGDVLGFARAVEEAIGRERAQPGWCAQRGARASQFVLENYTLDRERTDVLAFYREAISAAARKAAA